MNSNPHYILAVGTQGAERLKILGNVYFPSSKHFLQQCGLKAGMCVADIGCGTGNMTQWLSQQVGPTGKVLAIDSSSEQLAVAQATTQQAGLTNVEYRQASIYQLDELQEQFDLVYCRFVLAHLQQPQLALQAMYKLVASQGILACEEIESSTWDSYPRFPAYRKHVDLFNQLGAKRQVNFDIGPQLYGLFRNSAVAEIKVSIAQPIFKNFAEKSHAALVTQECGSAYLEAGIITQEELEMLVQELARLANEEDFLMIGVRIFQVQGQKVR